MDVQLHALIGNSLVSIGLHRFPEPLLCTILHIFREIAEQTAWCRSLSVASICAIGLKNDPCPFRYIIPRKISICLSVAQPCLGRKGYFEDDLLYKECGDGL